MLVSSGRGRGKCYRVICVTHPVGSFPQNRARRKVKTHPDRNVSHKTRSNAGMGHASAFICTDLKSWAVKHYPQH